MVKRKKETKFEHIIYSRESEGAGEKARFIVFFYFEEYLFGKAKQSLWIDEQLEDQKVIVFLYFEARNGCDHNQKSLQKLQTFLTF